MGLADQRPGCATPHRIAGRTNPRAPGVGIVTSTRTGLLYFPLLLVPAFGEAFV